MPDWLDIALKNDSISSATLFAYVTGIAIHDGRRCLLKANGRDLYYPQDPPAIGSPLTEDCAIPLGNPGSTTAIRIPQIAGGRIWISDGPLHFLLNPGPALVEPSVLNPADPNANVDFGFCEFTLNDAQLYANISYVDFVPRIPIALSLRQASGQTQHVAGMPADGLDQLVAKLRDQSQRDNQPWEKLIVQHQGRNLRVLNATHGNAVGANFDGYFEPYVDRVWDKYSSQSVFSIDTQGAAGTLDGRVASDGQLCVGDERFTKPCTADIFGCNSGPFTTGPSPIRNAIIPRLAAAFVRSTLLHAEAHPSGPETFYRTDPTNHYARCVHEVNMDGRGYAFAYDDVAPSGGADQSGKVNAGDPLLFTVAVGGKTTTAQRRQIDDQNHPSPAVGYHRPAPPPPPQDLQVSPGSTQPEHHGWKERMKSLADRLSK